MGNSGFGGVTLGIGGKCVFLPGLEPIVPVFLQVTLEHAGLQELPGLLPEKYLLLDLHGVSEVLVLSDFVLGLDPRSVEHLVIALKSLHHGFK
jgi:hypothetical protein